MFDARKNFYTPMVFFVCLMYTGNFVRSTPKIKKKTLGLKFFTVRVNQALRNW